MTRFVGLTICATCLLSLAACSRSTTGSQANPPDSTEAARVPVAKVELATLPRTVEVPAEVHGYVEADIYARVPGYVADVPVDIGDSVPAGEILVQLSTPELEDAVEQKAADVKVAEAELEEAQESVKGAETGLQVARAELRQKQALVEAAQAEVTLRESELKRWEELTANDPAIEKRKVDEARYALESAKARLNAALAAVATAEASVRLAEATLASRRAEERSAQQKLESARVALKAARTMAAYSTLKAPWPAVVIARYVHPGDFALPAATNSAAQPLLRLARADRLRVVGHVAAGDTRFLDPGDSVELYGFASAPDLRITDVVTRIAPALDPETRLMRCEVHLDNPQKGGEFLLSPGTFGYMRITLEVYENRPVVPSSALLMDSSGQAYILVLDEQNTVQRRDVTVLYDTGVRAVISGDVKPGDRVVRSGGGKLKPGEQVSPAPDS